MIRTLVCALAAGVALAGAARAQQVNLEAATIPQLSAAMDAGRLTSEQLVRLSLARMDAYDDAGPRLNAVIIRNPRAVAEARALDVERRSNGRRSPLHGIPVVLKDNYDTADMPTTGGSVFLEGSIPPDDAFLVKKLRDAGAVIVAKVNLSEFAAGGAYSSLGGQTRNPHDTTRSPLGSSGGTAVAIAAAYAELGLGTDTGGSVRMPAAANGIVGLRPTLGLLSRDGIIPLALSFDTGGPMARNVTDVAVSLGVLAGPDLADPVTARSAGRSSADYSGWLKPDALRGMRIGVARDFMGNEPEFDWVMEASIARIKAAGATVVDVRFPKWLLDSKLEFYLAVRWPEFRTQLKTYLATLNPGYPRSLEEMVQRSYQVTAPRPDGAGPNAVRWALFLREQGAGSVTDPAYTAVHDHGLPLAAGAIDAVFVANGVDAIVYPTLSERPELIGGVPRATPAPGSTAGTGGTLLASLAGLPELVVPAGFTTDGLPVGISFVGRAFEDGKLLGMGYAFEQATRARRLPASTPPLREEALSLARSSSRR